jgi:flavin-dependent dehydrogenase
MRELGPTPLANDARVVIIGGGPAGTATAIALLKLASQLGRQIRVVIVEEKQFAAEIHHNQCVGVLSPPIAEVIEHDLGVAFPKHLNRTSITGYVLHTARQRIILDGSAEPSYALRRVQFDAYMLEAARQCGAEILAARVTDLKIHPDRVVVYTNREPLKADLVVGAFGLDEGTAMFFQRAVGYCPPPALSSIVTKYHPGDQGMQKFGQRIHAFLPGNPRIEFGGITPKGNHLTINIAGNAVDAGLMEDFICMPDVRSTLPNLGKRRSHRPERYALLQRPLSVWAGPQLFR